jgi:mRNA interferase MazF
MNKDFDEWNSKKKIINQKDTENIFFRVREVWWCHLGLNVGYEQDGKSKEFRRPILIFKKFNAKTFWAISLTSQNKIGKYYFSFDTLDCMDTKVRNTANLSQLKLTDSKRLIDKMGYISEADFLELKTRMKDIMDDQEWKYETASYEGGSEPEGHI